MTRPPRLGDAEIEYALANLKGWSRTGNALTKTFAFQTFPDAIAWVNRAAEVAEGIDHHPDLDIRYTKVTATLATHSAGGLTRLDFDLAKELDALL